MVFERIFKKREKPKKVEVKKVSPAEKFAGIESALILTSPHVTEKSTRLSSHNQYVFKVFPKANKIEIKKAIESLYRVKVIGVRIINVPAKERRLGKTKGWTKGYKKAIVKIKEGQKIDAVSI